MLEIHVLQTRQSSASRLAYAHICKVAKLLGNLKSFGSSTVYSVSCKLRILLYNLYLFTVSARIAANHQRKCANVLLFYARSQIKVLSLLPSSGIVAINKTMFHFDNMRDRVVAKARSRDDFE